MTHLFGNWKFDFLTSLTYFIHSHTSPSGNHLLVLCVYDSDSVFMFVHLFCILDDIYKWNHMTFVFLCFNSLRILSSMLIHVVTNGMIPLFFMAE